MKRFVEGENRQQMILLPDCLDDYVVEDNPVRVIDVFIDELDLAALGFEGMLPATTGRPAYHPATLLKIYLYGYLNRIPSSRRLEREAQRNIKLMWLTGRLMPDFKTIADFRKDNGAAIRAVCRQFMVLCRRLKLFTEAVVAVDGSKFKAVNNRDKNFTPNKIQRRMEQIEASSLYPIAPQPFPHTSQKIMVLVHRAALDRHVAPERGKSFSRPGAPSTMTSSGVFRPRLTRSS